jgi:hypothetical protein
MTPLEQLLVIVKKEMKSKQLLMNHDGNDKATKNYWSGGLSALTYIKHVIERLIKEEK